MSRITSMEDRPYDRRDAQRLRRPPALDIDWRVLAACVGASSLLCAAVAWLVYLSGALLGGGGAVVATLVLGAALGTWRYRDQRSRRQAREAALADVLTSLPNRRALDRALERELDRVRRYGEPLSLAVFDVDDFKSINDTFGHKAGDAALVTLARVVEETLRTSDVLARWAGDEFVILSPSTDVSGGHTLAERVRAAVEATVFAHGRPVTISIGVAHYVDGDSAATLFDRADTALFEAKRSGRNRSAGSRFLRSTGTYSALP